MPRQSRPPHPSPRFVSSPFDPSHTALDLNARFRPMDIDTSNFFLGCILRWVHTHTPWSRNTSTSNAPAAGGPATHTTQATRQTSRSSLSPYQSAILVRNAPNLSVQLVARQQSVFNTTHDVLDSSIENLPGSHSSLLRARRSETSCHHRDPQGSDSLSRAHLQYRRGSPLRDSPVSCYSVPSGNPCWKIPSALQSASQRACST